MFLVEKNYPVNNHTCLKSTLKTLEQGMKHVQSLS